MTFEEAKKERDEAEIERIIAHQQLERADARLEKAIVATQDSCPHNNVGGRVIKWCSDCGHVETFWSFPKRGGKKHVR